MDQINHPFDLKAIKAIISELKGNPKIKLKFPPQINPPCRPNTYDLIANNTGLHFSEGIRSFYNTADGLRLSWEYNKKYKGEINILPIMDTVLEANDEFWKKDLERINPSQDNTFRLFIKKLYSFEVYDDTTDGNVRTLFEIDKSVTSPGSPSIWLWQIAGERFPLTLNFEDYLSILLKTRGFFGWPFFFIDLSKCQFDDPYFSKYFAASCADAIPKMKDFLMVMPKLFPKDDFTVFEMLQKKLIENYETT